MDLTLANIIEKLGGNRNDCRRDGYIEYAERINDTTLILNTSSNWSECQDFNLLLHTYLPKIKINYTAEEPGCGYYVTTSNDKNRDKYVLDSSICWNWDWNDGSSFAYFKNLKDLVNALNKEFNTTEIKYSIKSINRFIKKIKEEKEKNGERLFFHVSPIHKVNPLRNDEI